MTRKKQYKNRLPTVLPPAPRRPTAEESTAPQGAAPTSVASAPVTVVAAATTPVETPVPRPSATLLRTRALVAAAVLIGLVGVAATLWWQSGEEPAQRPSAAASATWPEAGAARTVTQVRPDGVLEVTHWIHATDPLDELDLILPERQEGDPIRASAVQVVADDRPASGPAVLTFSRASYVFADATRIRVHYELSGAVELSTSAPGRGLATTTSLEVSATQARDTRVVRSPAVLSLACTDTTGAIAPCGASDHPGQWTVKLTGDDVGARVVAVVTVTS